MDTNQFELIKELDDVVGVKEHKWYGKTDQTDEKLMHDKGKGEPVVIRLFEFKFSPDLKATPTKEQILTPEYINHLKALLWGDSLRMVLEPRAEITKEGCRIFVPCVARTGATFTEEPKLLQEWIK